MKIFWSWQSDTPGSTGRFLVRDALTEAVDQLKQSSDIDDAVRERLHVDHDIKDIPGSPDLVRTIFAKIDAAEIVVADVTLVGEVSNAAALDKKLINSNVAIELGYALHARTDRNVLLVFNAHYGHHEQLPFDLRHKGGAIVFDLRPDAERREIDEQRGKLRGLFVRALRTFVEQGAGRKAVRFSETPCTFNRAAYFDQLEPIAHSDRDWAYPKQGLCYFRLIPGSDLAAPLELALLKEVIQDAPLLRDGEYQMVYSGLNRYGAIKCTFNEHWLTASTQLFQNGELWCVSASLVKTERDNIPDWVKLPFVIALVLEQIYYDTVRKAVEFGQRNLGLRPPYEVELGLVDVDRAYLAMQGGQKGPIRKSEVFEKRLVGEGGTEALNSVMLSFFSRVFDSVGERRQANLFGFPPDRPSAAR
jgi:hypothetical protein